MTDSTPGKVTAYLEGVRERHALVTGPESGNCSRLTDLHDASYQLSHEDGRRLLAVAEVALRRHRRSAFPATMGEHRGRHWCPSCTASVDDQVLYVDWPCPEYVAVSAALLGEVADGG